MFQSIVNKDIVESHLDILWSSIQRKNSSGCRKRPRNVLCRHALWIAVFEYVRAHKGTVKREARITTLANYRHVAVFEQKVVHEDLNAETVVSCQ